MQRTCTELPDARLQLFPGARDLLIAALHHITQRDVLFASHPFTSGDVVVHIGEFMVTVALVVELEAKAELADKLAAFLTSALPLAQAEPETTAWFALRTSPTTFWIVDAFPNDAGRQAHLQGPIAAALMASAEELLASPPRLLSADVLASKLPA